jgi:5-methylcytosine-specific restriction endonuclease McrA
MKQLITKSGSGHTRSIESIYSRRPHPHSRAAYLLLVEKLTLQDVDYLQVKTELYQYEEFRWAFLLMELQHDGDLHCHYCGTGHLNPGHKHSNTNNKIPNLATIDHKIPLSQGGPRLDPLNCVVACRRCNKLKGVMSYESFLAQKPWLTGRLSRKKRKIQKFHPELLPFI